MRLIALSLVLALGACGGKSKPTTQPTTPEVVADPKPAEPTPTGPKATPSDAELDALFGRTLDFFDKLSVVVAASGTDCKKMAAGVDQTFNDSQALIDEAKAYKGNAEVDAKADAYMEQHHDRLEAATEKMKPGLESCSQDPDLVTAMKRFDEI